EAQKILNDFVELIKQEISVEAGTNFIDLPAEIQKLLVVDSVKEITESKWKILARISTTGTNSQAQTREKEQITTDEVLQQQELEEVLNLIKNANGSEELGNIFREIKKDAFYLNHKQRINDAYRAEALVEFQRILAIIQNSQAVAEIKNLTARID